MLKLQFILYISISTIIAAICGFLIYLYPDKTSTIAIIYLIYLITAGAIMLTHYQHNKRRQQWKDDPMDCTTADFDDFFWGLTIYNQDWYIEEILTAAELKAILERYEVTIRQIWQEPDMEIWEKLERTSTYMRYIKSLLCTLEFCTCCKKKAAN